MKVQELFIKPQTPETVQELAEAKARLATKLPRPPLSDLIDHIDHMVKVAGVDHVGWARISTASIARRKGWIRSPTCPRSRQALVRTRL